MFAKFDYQNLIKWLKLDYNCACKHTQQHSLFNLLHEGSCENVDQTKCPSGIYTQLKSSSLIVL